MQKLWLHIVKFIKYFIGWILIQKQRCLPETESYNRKVRVGSTFQQQYFYTWNGFPQLSTSQTCRNPSVGCIHPYPSPYCRVQCPSEEYASVNDIKRIIKGVFLLVVYVKMLLMPFWLLNPWYQRLKLPWKIFLHKLLRRKTFQTVIRVPVW